MSTTTPAVSAPVRDLAASARLVYLVLRVRDRPLSQADLRAETGLTAETIRRALRRLAAADVVDEHPHDQDGRKQLYALTEPEPTSPPDHPYTIRD
jgi:DNA-binding MarR family transcriptional regulator